MLNLKKILKESTIPISISIGMILTLEVGYRLARKFNFNLTNIDQSTIFFKKIAYDNKYSVKEIKKMIKMDGFIDDLNYAPWIQIGNNDHINKYSIVKEGKRLTIRSPLTCSSPIEVWFFGGSTTYGTGVTWEDTIPSNFVNETAKQSFCVSATNFGVPYHYSLQENMHLISQLIKAKDREPEIVIFIDGLNDFIQISSSINNEPFFTKGLKNLFSLNKISWHKKKLDEPIIKLNLAVVDYLRNKIAPPKNNKSNYSIPNGKSIETSALEIADNMIRNRELAENICKMYKLKCFQFIQPVPAINNPRNFQENLSSLNNSDYKKLFSIGYLRYFNNVKESNDSNLQTYDISKVFLDYKGIPYVDPWHYSPRANNLLSKKILEFLYKDLKNLSEK